MNAPSKGHSFMMREKRPFPKKDLLRNKKLKNYNFGPQQAILLAHIIPPFPNHAAVRVYHTSSFLDQYWKKLLKNNTTSYFYCFGSLIFDYFLTFSQVKVSTVTCYFLFLSGYFLNDIIFSLMGF